MMGDEDDPTRVLRPLPVARRLGAAARGAGPHGRRRDRAPRLARRARGATSPPGGTPDHDFSAALPLLRQLLALERRAGGRRPGRRERPGRPRHARDHRPQRGTTPSASSSGCCARRSRPTRTDSTPGTRGSPRRGWRTSARRRPTASRSAPTAGSRTCSRGRGGASAGLRARPVARARHDRRDPAQRLVGASAATPRAPASRSTSPRIASAARAGSSTACATARISAALLGARLERRLQDAGIAGQIEDLRKAALRAAGSTAPPTAIVDGLLRRPRARVPAGARGRA